MLESKCSGTASPALRMTYFDAYRQGRGTANLIHAQRDFFGAHGFDRVDGKARLATFRSAR